MRQVLWKEGPPQDRASTHRVRLHVSDTRLYSNRPQTSYAVLRSAGNATVAARSDSFERRNRFRR